ncbi:hypothetical protein PHMEG_00013445, partial [Phytophthora megakarya]
PSVLGRAFAIEFGIRGLSFMHFAPFNSLNDKAVWIMTSGVNMQNFSSTVALPVVPQAESIDDILEALQSLVIFGAEYYSPTFSQLLDTSTSFVKHHLRRMQWEQSDLVLVAYWINSILESFRGELERNTSDGSLIKLRCTKEDADFRQILTTIHQRQVAEIRAAISFSNPKKLPTTSKAVPSSQSHHISQRRVQRESKSEPSIPPDVYAQLPVQDGKRLCLRFLSNAGCRANNGSSCLSSRQAHFVPEKFNPLVRNFVTERFGGLKSEHAFL